MSSNCSSGRFCASFMKSFSNFLRVFFVRIYKNRQTKNVNPNEDHTYTPYPSIKKISKLSGGILLIDYGYLNNNSSSTIQAVMNNKKISDKAMIRNLGRADISSLVNFSLLKEYFLKNNLKVKKIVTQRFFLERMGIIERAQILEKKMTNAEKKYMQGTLVRLLEEKQMGSLFKVIFGYKNKNNDFFGFE